MKEMQTRAKLLQDNMAERIGKFMVQLAYYEKENRFSELKRHFEMDLGNIKATIERVELLKNVTREVSASSLWREKVKRLENEKKELLKVNFVS